MNGLNTLKTGLILLFLWAFSGLSAQTADSLVVRQEIDSLLQRSKELADQKKYEEALRTAEGAVQKNAAAWGENTALTHRCWLQVSRMHYLKGDRPTAEAFALKAKLLGEQLGLARTVDQSHVLNILSNIEKGKGHFKEAEALLLDIKSIRVAALGTENALYALTLFALGNLYFDFGFFDTAESSYLEAESIQQRFPGTEHPDYAATLNNLGNLYINLGNFDKAEALHLKAREIRARTEGKMSMNYSRSLDGLANIYSNLGLYRKAEPLYLESLDIKEKLTGPENAAYTITLGNLGNLYNNLGLLSEAERCYQRSLQLREKAVGKESELYGSAVANLANLYNKKGAYKQAEALYLEAKAIKENTTGKQHPTYLHFLNNFASLYASMGELEKAEKLFDEALALIEKSNNFESLIACATYSNIGQFYANQSQDKQAQVYFEKGRTQSLASLGAHNEHYLTAVKGLALLQRRAKHYPEAEALFAEIPVAQRSNLYDVGVFLSESELQEISDAYFADMNAYNALLQEQTSARSPRAARIAFDNALFFKGFLLHAVQALKARAGDTPASKELLSNLEAVHRRLAKQYSQPFAQRDSSLVAALEAKSKVLERDLSRTTAHFDDSRQWITTAEVRAHLQPQEAALEFIHFPGLNEYGKPTDTLRYAALLLTAADTVPRFISLFEESQLQQILAAKSRKADYASAVYGYSDRGFVQTRANLYHLIWQPIEPFLPGISTIYFSPSGLLHRLNLDAIPITLDSTLADRYKLVQLGSTRQIAINSPRTMENTQAVLLGGISYDMDSTAIAHANAGMAARARGGITFSMTDSTQRARTWQYLPYTLKEVQSVAKVLENAHFSYQLRQGYEASEEAVKSLCAGTAPSPRVLHIATHGYFFSDPEAPSATAETSPAFSSSEHPMIRSGLILAGGNDAWQNKRASENQEDGILTAYEISQLNLQNTELVVLSACETGLGDIKGNEGVYGLQRAFKIAGVQYLIMSLWQVPDKQTALLMTTFYKKWLDDKMPIPDALRAAQKELREAGMDPYYWAGFVVVE